LLHHLATVASEIDVRYVVDTSFVPYRDLPPVQRIHRLLSLLDTLRPAAGDRVVLLGPSMSVEPRDALAEASGAAQIRLVHGVDLLATSLAERVQIAPFVLCGFDPADAAVVSGGRSDVDIVTLAEDDDEARLEACVRARGAERPCYVVGPAASFDRVRQAVERLDPGAAVLDLAEDLAIATTIGATAPGALRVLVTDPGAEVVAGAFDLDGRRPDVLPVDSREA